MSYPHVIRLRGPWEYQALARSVANKDNPLAEETAGLPPPGRLRLPADWGAALGPSFRGRVRFLRRFNRPSGLESRERVWLVAEGADARGHVELNGQPLGEIPGYALPARFDVTECLAERNELAIEVESPAAATLRPGRETRPGGLIREVRLEIQLGVAVHGLAVWIDANEPALLHIQGNVVGDAATTSVLATGMNRELVFEQVDREFGFTSQVPDLPEWSPGSPCSPVPIDIHLLHGGEAVWETTRAVASRCATSAGTAAHAMRHEEIATTAQYERFDGQGMAIVQAMPLAWSEEICPRLAHHPSIVAWTVPEGETREMPHEASYGRPWVSRDV